MDNEPVSSTPALRAYLLARWPEWSTRLGLLLLPLSAALPQPWEGAAWVIGGLLAGVPTTDLEARFLRRG